MPYAGLASCRVFFALKKTPQFKPVIDHAAMLSFALVCLDSNEARGATPAAPRSATMHSKSSDVAPIDIHAVTYNPDMHALASDTRLIKSWFGLLFALTCAGLYVYLWWDSHSLNYALGAVGFLCWAYPWSQITRPIRHFFAKNDRPMDLASTVLTYLGWTLLVGSVAARFFQ